MELFKEELNVINVGAKKFHDAIKAQGDKSIHVDWSPPAGGDEEAADILDDLEDL